MSNWRIITGDCRDVLRSLPAQSVHTCVTSPCPWCHGRGWYPAKDNRCAACNGTGRAKRYP